MELQAGMQTLYLNWRNVVEALPNVVSDWVPIGYYKQDGFIEKLKFLPGGVRAALRTYADIKEGLAAGDSAHDAVLFNTYNPAVMYPGKLPGNRRFLMFDVTPIQYDKMAKWYEHEADKNNWFQSLKRRRVTEVLKQADGLFVWSNWAAQSAIEDYGVSPEQVHLLPPGIDPNHWQPLPETERPNDGVTRILFTGYAFERKGGDLLLRWARESSRKDWEIHIVTMHPMEAPQGVTVHTGLKSNSPELVRLTQSCDLFVLPTRADCFSLVSLEAMAVGLPVITTNVGGIPDIVVEGETGYLIPPENYDALCAKLNLLLDSPQLRRQLGQKGRERVCSHFNRDASVYKGIQIMMGAKVA